jgi:hypothetical protein
MSGTMKMFEFPGSPLGRSHLLSPLGNRLIKMLSDLRARTRAGPPCLMLLQGSADGRRSIN